MRSIVRYLAVPAIACVGLWLGGCGGKPTTDSASTSAGDEHEGDHDHEGDDHEGHDHAGDGHDGEGHEGHDHDHGHIHGPHDGEIIELAGAAPGEVWHAEWTHEDESGLVTVYILDADAKKERPIDASEVTIEVRVENKPPVTYSLVAVGADADGKSSRFEIEEPELLTALLLKDAVDAELQVPIDDNTLTGKVEFVEHEHHH
jgi:hypothetical protein